MTDAFVSPNGITVYSYKLKGNTKAVFYSCFFLI